MINNNLVHEDERLDDLQINNKFIIQKPDEYCFTSDAVLLANFCKIKHNETVADFCSGSGVVGILASQKNSFKKIFLIEKQESFSERANRSILYNNLQDKIECINTSVQMAHTFLKKPMDVILCNPPYSAPKGNKMTENASLNMCKYETELTLKELIESVNKNLKFGGRFYMVHRSDRIAEIVSELKLKNLEPKQIQFVHPREKLNSNVCLIEAIKGAKQGVIILPPKIVEEI